jgi:protein-S-isoprenylcysteine O-methyltransferase Ste14
MYLGAALALASAALCYQSVALLLFVCGFLLVTHLFVVIYEEPTLKRTFGPDYEMYCHTVHRWWPRLHVAH